MKAINLNLSVLWADEDYKNKYGRTYFTFIEAQKLKFKDGWRLPTDNEYQEMFDALRKTKIKIDNNLAFRFRRNKKENELIFLANGFQDPKGIRLICNNSAAFRLTSTWWGSSHYLEANIEDKKIGWGYADGDRVPIRLVKDNPNFKGDKPKYIIIP